MTAFGFESTTDDVLDGVDLTGKRVLVTGASTGLGEETAVGVGGPRCSGDDGRARPAAR